MQKPQKLHSLSPVKFSLKLCGSCIRVTDYNMHTYEYICVENITDIHEYVRSNNCNYCGFDQRFAAGEVINVANCFKNEHTVYL